MALSATLRRHLVIGTTVAAFMCGPALAGTWTVIDEDSRLGVTATQLGSEFTAEFQSFQGDIVFDPAELSDAHVRMEIDVSSFNSGSRDRDANVTDSEWFDADNHPTAIFETTEFRQTDTGYEADATLTIKGVSHDVTLPFTLDFEGDRAHMQGELEIIRTRFNIGEGQWASGDTVGLTVTVMVDLAARRAD